MVLFSTELSRSPTIVLCVRAACSSTTSLSRAAAFPVGAQRATIGKSPGEWARASSILATVYVLPVPGPPAITVSLPARAPAAAACWRFGPAFGEGRQEVIERGPYLRTGIGAGSRRPSFDEVQQEFLVAEVALQVQATANLHEGFLAPAVADHRAVPDGRRPSDGIGPGQRVDQLRWLALDNQCLALVRDIDADVPESGSPYRERGRQQGPPRRSRPTGGR